MKNNHQVALSLVTGAIVGAVVLGIVGKIVMVFVAYRIGSEPNVKDFIHNAIRQNTAG